MSSLMHIQCADKCALMGMGCYAAPCITSPCGGHAIALLLQPLHPDAMIGSIVRGSRGGNDEAAVAPSTSATRKPTARALVAPPRPGSY